MTRPLICVTLSGCTVDEMLKDAAMATATGADLVEIRLDKLWVVEQMPEPDPRKEEAEGGEGEYVRPKFVEPEMIPQPLDSVDVHTALASLKQGIELPVVLTCRPKRQGGHYPGAEEQRIEILSAAIESGVSWVDLELDIERKSRKALVDSAGGKTRIIASHHTSEQPPSASEIIQDVEDNSDGGEIVKMCYRTLGRHDGLRLFEAAWSLNGSDTPNAIMGSGSGGDWTRIHAPLLGQAMVYTTMETGWHLSRQGRINASDLRTAWQLLEYEAD